MSKVARKISGNEKIEPARGASAAAYILAQAPTGQITSDLADIFNRRDFIRDLFYAGAESDRALVESIIVRLAHLQDAESISLFIESAAYYDNLGEPLVALEIALRGLAQASKSSNISLQRKAHSAAAVLASRSCYFEQAFVLLERAIKLSAEESDPIGKFAVLCNVVATLQMSGLLEDAKELSLRLCEYPEESEAAEFMHLQNAINGSQLAQQLGDVVSVGVFEKVICKKVGLTSCLGPRRAYVEAHRALVLMNQKEYELACMSIQTAIDQRTDVDNPRVNAILYCAQAKCVSAQKIKKNVKPLITSLEALVHQTQAIPFHHEEILRALVTLHSESRTITGKVAAWRYFCQLNDYLVNIKHRQFFDKLCSVETCREGDRSEQIRDPSYNLPSTINELTVRLARESKSQGVVSHDVSRRTEKSSFHRRMLHRKIEAQFRTRKYEIAESWAFAADFRTQREGQHCLLVGRLSGMIAIELGLSGERAVTIDMASRLHDIGKVAINPDILHAASCGEVDSFFSIKLHTLAGAKLLALVDDEVFRVAAEIAKYHHEWWNGCGYPCGLEREEIPLEARICAVADAFVVLSNSSNDREGWQNTDAAKQISTMSGVQFDPTVVAAAVLAVNVFEKQKDEEYRGLDYRQQSNALLQAKTRLLEATRI